MPSTHGSAQKRLSGRRWQELRARILRANPLCVRCEQQGRIVAATVVDHIVALKDGGGYAAANLQGLCVPCHEVKTRGDMGQKVRGCDARGVPIDENHIWNRNEAG